MNMVPLNLAEEKKKFFFDPNYNPQFVYEQPIPEQYLTEKYGEFGGELMQKAKEICDSVIADYSKESSYLDAVEGKILTQEETVRFVTEYLTKNDLENKVTLRFVTNAIARTRMDGYVMYIRLPIEYREKSLLGVLDHEIGTHVFRRINDDKQSWCEKRQEYGLGSYLETEEGLAVLHFHLHASDYRIWFEAIQYYACALGAQHGFARVYTDLRSYIDDKDRRFKITLRAKRGMTDTSKPGGYTKDQVYLRGVVKIAKWLRANEYDVKKLYVGKVSLEDLPKVQKYSSDYNPIVPKFLQSKEYRKKIEKILQVNGF